VQHRRLAGLEPDQLTLQQQASRAGGWRAPETTARKRHLQGRYADTDSLLSTLHVLRRANPGT
jgi:hypothetical protein